MRAALVAILAVCSAFAGLPEVKSERNLERRAKLALENADHALSAARSAYAKQDTTATTASLKELEESIEVAQGALEDTGKDPRHRPKAFKLGESHTRELLRRMESFENEMDLDDRKMLDSAKAKLNEANEAWLLGIMNGRKKGEQ